MTADGWVVRLPAGGPGPRVAVKDAIAVAGLPTCGGSSALARRAQPAARDAACVAAVRASGGRIVGTTALTELCWDESGLHAWGSVPVNPLDARRMPGGSSSGSAVVVARDEADVALGSDTGGSVRIPAACCGVAALKTTWGRVPLDGVLPLAPSLDTVGPMAATVAGLALGMALLEPGFRPAPAGAPVVARLRVDVPVDPAVDAAVDAALAAAGWRVLERPVERWSALRAYGRLLGAEAARAWAHLLPDADLLRPETAAAIERGLRTPDAELTASQAALRREQPPFLRLLDGVDALALPTLDRFPPVIGSGDDGSMVSLTLAANVAGLPALSLPVPAAGSALPASVQLVGRPYGEEVLLGLGTALEAAVLVAAGR